MLLTDSKNPLSSILLRSKLSDARVRAFFSQSFICSPAAGCLSSLNPTKCARTALPKYD
jgi:hypothetical protein